MKHPSDHLTELFTRHDYPEEARRALLALEERIAGNPDFARRFDTAVCLLMGSAPDAVAPFPKVREPVSHGMAYGRVSELAAVFGEDPDLLQLLFALRASEILRVRYAEAGLPDTLFWASVTDFKYKLLECMECRGKPGTFVGWWNDGLFRMNRFTRGRFQYERHAFPAEDFTTSCGKVIRWGDPVANFHIPSSGVPLTDEVRLASYREAYEAYRPMFPDGKAVFFCESWLLYPAHDEFLPPGSNIRKFLHDFELVKSGESERFGDAWRVFGRAAERPPEEWPRDTSLRKAYAEWICSGRKAGWGWGVIVFDGEKILR